MDSKNLTFTVAALVYIISIGIQYGQSTNASAQVVPSSVTDSTSGPPEASTNIAPVNPNLRTDVDPDPMPTIVLKPNPNLDNSSNLPQSIIDQVQKLKKEVADRHLSFQVGYTDPLTQDFKKLAATKLDPNYLANAVQIDAQAEKVLEQRQKDYATLKSRLPVRVALAVHAFPQYSSEERTFSWQGALRIPGAKNQNPLGTCHVYASVAVLESVWTLVNGQALDASEQYVLDSIGTSVVDGGDPALIALFLTSNGTVTETEMPDHVPAYIDQNPPPPPIRLFKAAAYGFIDNGGLASVPDLKNALINYGPLAVCLHITPLFVAYQSGVFDEEQSGDLNHCVELLGWDDDKGAWLIRNSWGPGWGLNGGYMWIKYDSNNVGSYAMWIVPQRTAFQGGPIGQVIQSANLKLQ